MHSQLQSHCYSHQAGVIIPLESAKAEEMHMPHAGNAACGERVHRYDPASLLNTLSKRAGRGNINPIKHNQEWNSVQFRRDFVASSHTKWKHTLCHQQSSKSAFLRPAAQLLRQLDDSSCKLGVSANT